MDVIFVNFLFSSCLQIGTQQVNVVYHQQGRDVFVLTAEAQR